MAELLLKHTNKRHRRRKLLTGTCLFLLATIPAFFITVFSVDVKDYEAHHHQGRSLLQMDQVESEKQLNCTPRSIEQFPADFMTEKQRKQGGVLFHIFVSLYIFGALAIVCDDYFVPSLEKLTATLHIQADVAGATFMAAGSSAPELFTSVVGVIFAKSDVGLGTIVGSAIFNLLIILALVGLFAGQVLYLLWWPLVRDCSVYVISIIALITVIMDNLVEWYEAVTMLVLYILYIVLMYFNPKIGDFLIRRANVANISCLSSPKPEKPTVDSEKTPLLASDKEHCKGSRTSSAIHTQPQENFIHSNDLEGSAEYESPLAFPETWPKRITWIILLPLTILFMFTIPDCRRPNIWSKFWPLTFILSICWLGVLSYIMVWMVTISGDTLGIPDAVLGLTLLAAGTSIPDALASLFVAKNGYGDMAVSNSIGSNIFDILICLGLPWMLQTVFIKPGNGVYINSNGLVYTSAILLGTVLFLLITMVCYKWRLDKKIGCLLTATYLVLITVACLFETNVFGDINLPSCPKFIT